MFGIFKKKETVAPQTEKATPVAEKKIEIKSCVPASSSEYRFIQDTLEGMPSDKDLNVSVFPCCGHVADICIVCGAPHTLSEPCDVRRCQSCSDLNVTPEITIHFDCPHCAESLVLLDDTGFITANQLDYYEEFLSAYSSNSDGMQELKMSEIVALQHKYLNIIETIQDDEGISKCHIYVEECGCRTMRSVYSRELELIKRCEACQISIDAPNSSTVTKSYLEANPTRGHRYNSDPLNLVAPASVPELTQSVDVYVQKLAPYRITGASTRKFLSDILHEKTGLHLWELMRFKTEAAWLSGSDANSDAVALAMYPTLIKPVTELTEEDKNILANNRQSVPRYVTDRSIFELDDEDYDYDYDVDEDDSDDEDDEDRTGNEDCDICGHTTRLCKACLDSLEDEDEDED